MSIAQSFIPEFDSEMASTRLMLERFPDGRSDWKPHTKSMTLGRLASHVAELPGWLVVTLTQSDLDIAPPGAPHTTGSNLKTRAEIVKLFDEQKTQARAALVGAADPVFVQPWTLKKGGTAVFTLPKIVVLRSFVMNHLIHHRGQLSVYLRLNDVALPGIYGPTADELGM